MRIKEGGTKTPAISVKNLFELSSTSTMFNWSLTTFQIENNDTYNLEHYAYNYMLIFNHFDVDACDDVRLGTDLDVKSLCSTFSQIGFQIDEHNELTKAEIMDKLSILRDKDFTEYGCVAVVVLTHGGYGGTLMAKDLSYNEKDIIENFKSKTNRSLIAKPKILIIQACRGKSNEQSVGVGRTLVSSSPGKPDVSYFLSLEPDILVLHSSYPGTFSYRIPFLGTWFIQLLCYEIARCSPILDLESIFTNVKRDIAIYFTRKEINEETKKDELIKQMPVSTSTLTKKLYFRKHNDNVHFDRRDSHLKARRIYKLCREFDPRNESDPEFGFSLLYKL